MGDGFGTHFDSGFLVVYSGAASCRTSSRTNRRTPSIVCCTNLDTGKGAVMNIHWSHVLLAIIVGYVLAMYFPQIGATVKAKIAAA
jgi:hypothetical protein